MTNFRVRGGRRFDIEGFPWSGALRRMASWSPAAALLFAAMGLFLAAREEPSIAAEGEPAREGSFNVTLRERALLDKDSDRWSLTERREAWNPKETAVIVCDMWDYHHCLGATERVGEMAPRMNEVLKHARAQGALIIHSPSACMGHYIPHPAFQWPSKVAAAPNLPAGIRDWCHNISSEDGVRFPVDHSDGGCSTAGEPQREFREKLIAMKRNPGAPWTRQIETLEIDDADAISENGAVIWNVLEDRGIKNVIVLGVHTNMCVLGRPFGLRQMAKNGKNVVLMRDMTDTMYNPAKWPYVSHFSGNDLVVEHIEKYVCPTITSDQLIGGEPFKFKEDDRPHVVLVIAEYEYKTHDTLPRFAEMFLRDNFRVTVLGANPQETNDIEGIAAVADADVLVLSAWRRILPGKQLDFIKKHIAAGKPVVALRTSSHAFVPRGEVELSEDQMVWPEFTREVLGGDYKGHYGNFGGKAKEVATLVTRDAKAESHPILQGFPTEPLGVASWLYRASPLQETATPLLWGTVEGREEREPVAWTNRTESGSNVFYTSLGHPKEFEMPAFQRLLMNAVYWAAEREIPKELPLHAEARAELNRNLPAGSKPSAAKPQPKRALPDSWTALQVPGTWEEQAEGLFAEVDGFVWYRCRAQLPEEWRGKDITLKVESIDNAAEVYFDGRRVAALGGMPPNYANGLHESRMISLKAADRRDDETNGEYLVAVRVFDEGGRGGFKGAAPAILCDGKQLSLAGAWQFRAGDDLKWANIGEGTDANEQPKELFDKVTVVTAEELGKPPYPAEISAGMFQIPENGANENKVDLAVDLVLSEPEIVQPVFLNFDERGRMWVVQYIQYPMPAGLKITSRDSFWRNVYDRVPPAPPNHIRGADRITIHEDTDGDGTYDSHKVFIEGLSLVTSIERGRGGLWVLNPPYLLFYPDADGDDVPDGDPEVHLEGFGIEDSHAIANSLRWGPDGWLYGAQGSTVWSAVKRPGSDDSPVHSMGQAIWRYHPETRRYEVFSEGGGNAFGCEIDSQGRVFSGHNGGDTRGFHYMQGAYLQKGFDKHGQLSNPYAFGYFPAMRHRDRVQRFTHNFVIYEGSLFPAAYHGKLFGISPLQNYVCITNFERDRSTFRTGDEVYLSSRDTNFRPVDIKLGPDGCLYVADWYDAQCNHYRNHEGHIDKTRGRIYRVRPADFKAGAVADLSKLSAGELIQELEHPNRWRRQTALRLLADRKAEVAPMLEQLKRRVVEEKGQTALELTWLIGQCGALDDATSLRLLAHENPSVRAWTAQFLGNGRAALDDRIAAALVELATKETNVEVRAQLACTARRLPAAQGLPIVAELAAREEDKNEPRLPNLLWWAVEEQCTHDPEAVVAFLRARPSFWDASLTQTYLLESLMRRFSQTGKRADWEICAQIFEAVPEGKKYGQLMKGFERGVQGQSLAQLPDRLAKALANAGGGSLALRARQGDAEALAQVRRSMAEKSTPHAERLQFIALVSQLKLETAADDLLAIALEANHIDLRRAALAGLQAQATENAAGKLIEAYAELPEELRAPAADVLASRPTTSRLFIAGIEGGLYEADAIPIAAVKQMLRHRDEEIAARVAELWGEVKGATTAELERQIERLAKDIEAEPGSPYEGKKLFMASCGKCHLMFDEGGQIGPDLTTYDRANVAGMLLHVVNPSAEIREGYENYVALTAEGQVLSGLLVDQDENVVVLRSAEGQDMILRRDDLEELRADPQSLMPEGLLDDLTPQQVRDLFGYLRSTQPLKF